MSKKTKEVVIIIHMPHIGRKFTLEFLANTCLNVGPEKESWNDYGIGMLDIYDKYARDTMIDRIIVNGGFNVVNDGVSPYYYYKSKLRKNAHFLASNYSRLCYDVERFDDPDKEIMSKYGQGPVYTKTMCGNDLLRADRGKDYEKVVMEKYYYPYHEFFTNLVNELSKDNYVVILDIHSYKAANVMHYPTYDKSKPLPDVCIGYDNSIQNNNLVFMCAAHFHIWKLSCAVNYPYSGSIVPNNMKYPENVFSVMLEFHDKYTHLNKEALQAVANKYRTMLYALTDWIHNSPEMIDWR